MRTLNIALTFLFNIFFCMSLLAYDFDDLLSVNHTFENYYLKPVKKQSRAIASTPSLQKEEKNLSPFLDQGVNLDVNGNGKDDTWRTFKAGRLVSSKSDLNEDGKIVDINEGLKPKSKKSVKSDKLARYVMEVNSKTVKNKNIKLGDYIQIEKIKKLG